MNKGKYALITSFITLVFFSERIGIAQNTPTGDERSVLMLDDFESGLARWVANDSNRAKGDKDTPLCEILGTRPGAPEGSRGGAATLTFMKASDAWASISLAVDGAEWKKVAVTQICFWLKGDESENSIEVMLRTVSAAGEERKYSVAVPLANSRWEKIALPLSLFKDREGPVSERVDEIYLLQFVKRGTWPSLHATIDDVVVHGVATPKPPEQPQPAQIPRWAPPAQVTATVRFDTIPTGKVRTVLGANISVNPDLFIKNNEFRKSVRALGVRYARIVTSRTVAVQRKAGILAYDFTRLLSLVNALQSSYLEPLICIDRNPDWKLTDTELLGLCDSVFRAVNAAGRKPVIYWEMLNKPTFGPAAMSIDGAVAVYDRMRARGLTSGKSVLVGGLGAASPWKPHLETILDRVSNLDFLSYQIYGTHNRSTPDDELMQSARKAISIDLPLQASPEEVRDLISQSAYQNLPVFVTEAAPNWMQARDGAAIDKRLTTSFSAAWYATLVSVCAPYVDAFFPYDLTSPSWGLLDASARAYPAYYALWLVGTYAPTGARLHPVEGETGPILLRAARTKSAANVLLVNTSRESVICRVAVAGLGVVVKVRLRLLEPGVLGVQFNELPAKTEQKVTLKSYAVAVLQFVE